MRNILFNENSIFKFQQTANLFYLTTPELCSKYEIKLGFLTRLGGVSTGRFKTLNLYLRSGDSVEKVEKNYSILLDETGLREKEVFAPEQIHESKVQIISKDSGYKDCKFFKMVPGCDGLITEKKDFALMTFFADCTPVLFFDKNQKVIGAIHSGWRSTAENIVSEVINLVKRDGQDTFLRDLIFVIGPYIDQENFEVKQDAIDKFKERGTERFLDYYKKNNSYYIDLGKTVINQLVSSGVPENNIYSSGLSTFNNPELFFSFRRDGKPVGEHIGFIYFK